MFEHFSQAALKIVMYAQEEARRAKLSIATPEHILLGILRDPESLAYEILNKKNIDLNLLRKELSKEQGEGRASMEIHFSDEARKAFELAEDEATLFRHGQVESDHLLLGIVQLGDNHCLHILEKAGLYLAHLRWNILRLRYTKRNADLRTANLEMYSEDLTAKLEQRIMPTVVEWRPLVQRLIQFLGMQRKHSVLLVGEHGVGKTALVHALNQHILDSRIFRRFAHYRVVCIYVDKLLAEAKNDEKVYEVISSIMNEVRRSGDVILVVENIHQLFLANKKEMEFIITQQLLTWLEEPNTYCIATTIPQFYAYLKEKTPVKHLFQIMHIPKPPPEFCLQILEHWRLRLEKHHQIRILDGTLQQAVERAARMPSEQHLPESALTLLDLSAAHKVWQRAVAYQHYREADKDLRQLIEQRALIAPDVANSEAVRKTYEHIKLQILQTEERLQNLKKIVDEDKPSLYPEDILQNFDAEN